MIGVYIAWGIMILLAAVGYIMNIYKVIGPVVTGTYDFVVVAVRLMGVFVPPLGAIFGYF